MGWLGWGAAGAALPGNTPAAEPPPAGSTWFNVRDFGARGRGSDLDSPAFQRAIDRCSERGGVVVVPAGTYLCGTLRLRSRVALWLQPGAPMLGSTDLAHYPPITPRFRCHTDANYVERSLI